MRSEAAALLVLAVVLAVPVTIALARARWPARSPGLALACWQAVGLAGGLGLLGAGLTLTASGLGHGWLPGIAAVGARWPHLGVTGWTGICFTALIGVWLAVATMRSAARVVRARRSHRVMLDAVTSDWPGLHAVTSQRGPGGPQYSPAGPPGPGDLRLLSDPAAVAYCLPGLRPRIVVSQGAAAALTPHELDAVLAHEQAHLRGRHDLIVQPFLAWQETFPFLPAATEALTAVQLLVEMLADDRARRQCDPESLCGALRRLGHEQLAAGPEHGHRLERETAERITRLSLPPQPLPPRQRAAALLAAIVLVALPPAVLILS
jgi:hypothetical protein